MIVKNMDEAGNIVETEMTFEEWEKIWSPFRDGQPQDSDARQIYRDFVDNELQIWQYNSVPAELIADYAKYTALKNEYCDYPLSEYSNIYTELSNKLRDLIELKKEGKPLLK